MAIRLIVECFVAWTLSAALVIVSGYAAGVAPMLPSSYVRWDSGHYLAIATAGYEFFSCARLAGYDPTQWCGNAAWFPAYALLIRILSAAFDADKATIGFLISNIFYFGCLLLLRQVIEYAAPKRNNIVCFLMGSVFLGGIYYHTVFPIAMFMFFVLLTLLLLVRGHHLWASLAAAFGAFVYPTGFLLSGMVGVGVLINRNGSCLTFCEAFSGAVLTSKYPLSSSRFDRQSIARVRARPGARNWPYSR
jgi:hypothetical protein